MATDKQAQPKPAAVEFKRSADFASTYSNNAQLEPSLWDLKLTFGQTDQSVVPPIVMQHSAISLSWPEVKVLSYFLRAHVASHEAQVGRIVILPDIIPQPTQEKPHALSESALGVWRKTLEAMNKVYEDFMQENPEAKPR